MDDRQLCDTITQWNVRFPDVPKEAVNDLYYSLRSHSANPMTDTRGRCLNCVILKKRCEYLGKYRYCERCSMMPSLCVKFRICDAGIYTKWTDDLYLTRRRWTKFLNVPGCPINVCIYHFDEGPMLQIDAITFETSDPTAKTSYKKSTANWAIINSRLVALRGLQKKHLIEYFRQCINIFLNTYEQHVVVKQLLRRKGSPLCATTLGMLGMLGLLMRGWREGCDSAPEVLSNQMDSLLEYQIATRERQVLSMIQENWNLETDTTTISLVILAILLLIERDLWRLMHWALYECSRVDWKHPTPPADLMRASLRLAQVMLGWLHSVGPWPLDFAETQIALGELHEVGPCPLDLTDVSSFERPIRYDAGDPTSLDGSLLRRAFELKQNPTTAGTVVESLTFDNFIHSHGPEENQRFGVVDVNRLADVDTLSDFHFISSEDLSGSISETSSAPRDNQPGSEHGWLCF